MVRPDDLDEAIPFPPMEAELVRELPEGEEWQYEPKWDGFRGLLENGTGEVRLWSRRARPLLRYFPELAPLGDLLPPRSALDGEIVISRDGVLDFEAMQTRLHPAESRVRKLAAEIPASFIAFDVLVWDGRTAHTRPLVERREELERVAGAFILSPATRDRDEALTWMDSFETAGLDGVIAKRLDLPYRAGARDAVAKVKPEKTADCVVVGIRWKSRPDRIATLLLGLYGDDGDLLYVGSAAVAASRHAEIAERVLPLLDETSERRFSEPNRWGTGDLEETPLRPELVCEVRYDKVQGTRLRHGTKLLRFRDDKTPSECTLREIRPVPGPGDPTFESLIRGSRMTTSATTYGEPADSAELDVRRAVAPVRPLPQAHPDHQRHRDDPGEQRRAPVDALPVLVAPVTAQAAHHLAAPAEQDRHRDHRHHDQASRSPSAGRHRSRRLRERARRGTARSPAGTTWTSSSVL